MLQNFKEMSLSGYHKISVHFPAHTRPFWAIATRSWLKGVPGPGNMKNINTYLTKSGRIFCNLGFWHVLLGHVCAPEVLLLFHSKLSAIWHYSLRNFVGMTSAPTSSQSSKQRTQLHLQEGQHTLWGRRHWQRRDGVTKHISIFRYKDAWCLEDLLFTAPKWLT